MDAVREEDAHEGGVGAAGWMEGQEAALGRALHRPWGPKDRRGSQWS